MIELTGWFLKGIDSDEVPSSLEELSARSHRITLTRDELLRTEKWEPLLQGKKIEVQDGWVPLESLASFRRGIATGANNFFLISRKRLDEIDIKIERCLPCVGRANVVKGLIFCSADFERAASDGEKLLLLNLTDPLSVSEERYVREGEEQDLPSRFLLANRRPWYSMEQRPVAPIWAAVFGRGDLKFVFNEAGVRSLTNFHCLYPKSQSITFQRALTLCLNSSSVREASKLHGRVYGGGLNKFEPNDLKGILVPDLRSASDNLLEKMSAVLEELNAEPDSVVLNRKANQLCIDAAGEAATS